MKILTRKSDITINNRKMRVGELIANLKSLPSTEVRDFFIKQKKMIPRQVRCDVLRGIIDVQLKEKKVTSMLTDEMNYRLNWYNKFSEYQLENLLAFFNNPQLVDQFKEELWLAIVSRHDDLQIDDITLFTLYQKSINFRIESENTESLLDYNRVMDCIFYDEEGYIDGLSLAEFREVLLQSSTLVELREIGTKFGIDVPRRIKKNELMDIIVDELKEQGKLEGDVEEKIRKMSVVGLQRFAKDNGIKASIELKKEDIIEYIIKFMSAPEVSDAEKVVITESVKEEIQEDIQEEEPVEETKSPSEDVDFSNIDLADLFAPEEESKENKNPDIIVPDSTQKAAETVSEPAVEESFDDPMMGDGFDDMGIDMGLYAGMMENVPQEAKPQETVKVDETTTDEGNDAMAGFDMSNLDIIMPEENNGGSDSIFQFEDTKYEEPSVNTKPTDNNMFDETVPNNNNSSAQMGGFKSELNEFNRKLESLLAFQMKMLEKNNQSGPAATAPKKTTEKAGDDIFATVQAEVKQEKIEQARGLDVLKKMAEEGKLDPSKSAYANKFVEQGSYLPNKKEQEKESKKRQKERERAKKFMSPEELEYVKEQEAKEKEEARRRKDEDRAKKVSTGKNPLFKIFIFIIVIAVLALAFLGVVYFLCHGPNAYVKDGFLREIYDFFRRLAGRA